MENFNAMEFLENELRIRGVELDVFNEEQLKKTLDVIAGIVVEAYSEGFVLGEGLAKLAAAMGEETIPTSNTTGYLQ